MYYNGLLSYFHIEFLFFKIELFLKDFILYGIHSYRIEFFQMEFNSYSILSYGIPSYIICYNEFQFTYSSGVNPCCCSRSNLTGLSNTSTLNLHKSFSVTLTLYRTSTSIRATPLPRETTPSLPLTGTFWQTYFKVVLKRKV